MEEERNSQKDVLSNNGGTVDTFWEAFNTSRCKTAMLAVSIIITLAFGVSEVLNIPNAELHTMVIIIIGYWAGRTSKAKDKN